MTEEKTTTEATPKAKKKKWPIVTGIVVVVLVVAGAGFWTWHEQPSFCGAICHTPMDGYLATYEAAPGEATTDAYGIDVANASAMTAVKDAILIVGDALEPRDAPFEPRLGVLEWHRPADFLAELIDGADNVVYLGNIHTCIKHMNHLSVFVFGGAAALTIQDRNLPKETRSGHISPSSS